MVFVIYEKLKKNGYAGIWEQVFIKYWRRWEQLEIANGLITVVG